MTKDFTQTKKQKGKVLAVVLEIIILIGGIIFVNRDRVFDMVYSVRMTTMSDPVEGSYQYKTQNINCDVGGQSIYGVAYIPERNVPMPLALISHGLGGTHADVRAYAQSIASHGAAVYIFDFRGGGRRSRSDGTMTEKCRL